MVDWRHQPGIDAGEHAERQRVCSLDLVLRLLRQFVPQVDQLLAPVDHGCPFPLTTAVRRLAFEEGEPSGLSPYPPPPSSRPSLVILLGWNSRRGLWRGM